MLFFFWVIGWSGARRLKFRLSVERLFTHRTSDKAKNRPIFWRTYTLWNEVVFAVMSYFTDPINDWNEPVFDYSFLLLFF